MALIVEDGTGVAGAESYISAGELAQYLADYGLKGPSDPTKQEVLLRRATRALDALYPFLGDSFADGQSLHFPIDDGDGGAYLPRAVKDATAEMAVVMYEGVDPMGSLDEQAAGLTEVTRKIGDLTVTKKWAAGSFTAPQINRLRTIDLLLTGYYRPAAAAGDTWYSMEVVRRG